MPIKVNPETEKLWQKVHEQMMGISQDPGTKKYQIKYDPPYWDQLKALPDDLSTERNIDYKSLRDLLKAQKWEDADLETARLIFYTISHNTHYLYRPDAPALIKPPVSLVQHDSKPFYIDFNESDMTGFNSLVDLRTIDRLWVKYSQGRFGFSVQKHIWVKPGMSEHDMFLHETVTRVLKELGWGKSGDSVLGTSLTRFGIIVV